MKLFFNFTYNYIVCESIHKNNMFLYLNAFIDNFQLICKLRMKEHILLIVLYSINLEIL